MDVHAVSKYVKLSPTKARDLARTIQGKSVDDALDVVTVSHRKAAFELQKTLRSAMANAENNYELSVDQLRVKEAVVDQGPMMKRFWPRARGMVRPIQKRFSHIRIVLTDDDD